MQATIYDRTLYEQLPNMKSQFWGNGTWVTNSQLFSKTLNVLIMILQTSLFFIPAYGWWDKGHVWSWPSELLSICWTISLSVVCNDRGTDTTSAASKATSCAFSTARKKSIYGCKKFGNYYLLISKYCITETAYIYEAKWFMIWHDSSF